MEMSADPKDPWYPEELPAPRYITYAATAFSILVMIITIVVVCDAMLTNRIVPLYITIGAWAIWPPIWFWLEYFFIYRVWGKPGSLELFKYGQDVAKAIWAGVLAA